MRRFEKTFLILFMSIVVCLLLLPFGIPEDLILETHLEKALCYPLECGIFGKGENGIDLFYNTLAASQLAILLSVLVLLTTLIIGVPIGILSSLRGHKTDQTITLITNLFLSFPSLLIAIALSAFIGQGFFSTWLILSIAGWAPFTRLSRASSFQVLNQDYIVAAKSIGNSSFRISLKHILPNIVPILIVHSAFQLAGIIIVESTLSFLGLGVSQETPSLGRLIYTGKQYLLSHPHASLIPGAFILFLIMGFYLTGMIMDQNLSRRGVSG